MACITWFYHLYYVIIYIYNNILILVNRKVYIYIFIYLYALYFSCSYQSVLSLTTIITLMIIKHSMHHQIWKQHSTKRVTIHSMTSSTTHFWPITPNQLRHVMSLANHIITPCKVSRRYVTPPGRLHTSIVYVIAGNTQVINRNWVKQWCVSLRMCRRHTSDVTAYDTYSLRYTLHVFAYM